MMTTTQTKDETMQDDDTPAAEWREAVTARVELTLLLHAHGVHVDGQPVVRSIQCVRLLTDTADIEAMLTPALRHHVQRSALLQLQDRMDPAVAP